MATRSTKSDDPAWQGKEQRQAIRLIVDWAASVAADTFGTKVVHVTDCTIRGCRIETDLAVAVGTFVNIAIPRFTEVCGWVAWSSPEAMGIDFSHPLPSRVLEYLIERNGSLEARSDCDQVPASGLIGDSDVRDLLNSAVP